MEHTGITQRPPAYAELLVDSLDRYNAGVGAVNNQTSSSDWQTRLNQIVLNGYFTRLAVTQIHLYWSLPTIIANYNDLFRVTVLGPGAGQYLITVPQGYYTPTTLAAALQAALQAAAPAANFTCAFQGPLPAGVAPLTGTAAGFVFGVGAGTTFTFSTPPGFNITSANRFTRFCQTIGLVIGRAQANYYLTSPPLMYATPFIDICSSTLTKYQRVKDTTTLNSPTVSNVIARVYPTAPNTNRYLTDVTTPNESPFWICIDYNTPKHIKWDPNEPLSNFDLQLRDAFGDILPYDLTNSQYGVEYQLTILATES